jgi:hypothetical protein
MDDPSAPIFQLTVRPPGPIARATPSPRFAKGTAERPKHEVRTMIAASAAAPPPRIVVTVAGSEADAELIRILDAPLAPGETSLAGFTRKEVDLGAVFAALSVPTARALQARLTNPKPGDVLADRFGRLTADRRNRLISFLADARRRAAIAQARGVQP